MSVFTFDQPLAIVDIETTGVSPVRNKIIDIAIIRIENGVVVETLNTVVDPGRYIPPAIIEMTGIKEEDLRAAPTFNDISHDVLGLLEGAVFVAHNVRFDYSFIKSEFNQLGMRFSSKRLCTVALSRALYPKEQRHDLTTIIDRFGFVCEDRHRALPDAQVLVDFLTHSQNNFEHIDLKQKIQKVLGTSRVPLNLPSEVIPSLPEQPGVYIFYGEDGEKLYIGKSINIRKRVMSHFSSPETGKALRIVEEVRDVEARTTTGEFGALLLESYLINKEQPLYNRLARRTKKLVIVKEEISQEGYKRANIETLNSEDMHSSENIIGIFRSISQAKKILNYYAAEYTLCPQLLGVEKNAAGRGCFYSQLGKCNGACAGREESLSYNSRFDTAFSERKVKTWPYKGPILIDEKSSTDRSKGTIFVIDQWKLVASYCYDEAGHTQFLPQEYTFDYDSYRIMISRLKMGTKGVKTLTQSEVERLLTKPV